MGNAMFSAALDYRFAWASVGTWLIVVLMISIVASIMPARNATKVSVRQSLAYA